MKKRYTLLTKTAVVAITSSVLSSAAWADLDRSDMQAALLDLHLHQTELAEIAHERAERDEVAQLAATLERDHTLLAEWLQEADEGDGEPPVSEATLYDSEAYAALQELEAAAFDAAYLDYQLKLHTAAVEFLEQHRPQGDAQLDEFHNHLFITHQSLLVNGELINSLR